MRKKSKSAVCVLFAAWAGLALFAPRAEAADNVATNSGYWTNAAIWSAGAVPAAGHDVVIPAGITVTNTGLATTSINSLTITGTLTHATNASTETHKLILDIAGNLTIAAGGKIDVSEKGYVFGGPGQAPLGTAGGGNQRGGNGYGGEGGSTNAKWGIGGNAYGSVTNPVALGSGNSRAGGGVVRIQVAGAITNNGAILANGRNGADGVTSGGGAGGSIHIIAGRLAGTGTVTAAGGLGSTGWTMGGGAGGRIAVALTNGTFGAFPVTNITAIGGSVNFTDGSGAAGTVWLKDTNQTYGTLVVRNFTTVYQTAARTLLTNDAFRFDNIVVTNRGQLAVGTNATLDLRGCSLSGDNNTGVAGVNIGGRILFGLPGGAITWPSPFTNAATLSQVGTNLFTIGADVILASGGMFTHEMNTSTEAHKLNVKIDGALSVHTGAAINVSLCGYTGGYGPGTPPAGEGGAVRAGAGHGGQGGRCLQSGFAGLGGASYGSVTNPGALGSGGKVKTGGGAAILQVAGAMILNGAITANGQAGADSADCGGGAGGSINLTAATLSGNGTMTAAGGNGSDGWNMGGGGGGRVAVALTGGDFSAFPVTNITAFGGNVVSGDTLQEPGAAGTVYLKTGSQTYGTLVVANSNLVTAAATLIGTNVTDAIVGDVALQNRGRLGVYTNLSLTVYGNWTNGTTNAVSGGGAVVFTGVSTNTLYGNTTFDSVTCQTPGKTLKFEAGKTNAMTTGIILTGVPGSNLFLRSTVDGAQWKLNVMASATTKTFQYLNVQDSDARPSAAPIAPQNSTPAYQPDGNNSNWTFAVAGQTNIWTGAASSNWTDIANWSLGNEPVPQDARVVIPSACLRYPFLSGPVTINELEMQSGSSLRTSNQTLIVNGAATIAGALIAAGTETLTFNSNVAFTAGGVFTAAQSTFRLAGSAAQVLTANGSAFYTLNIAQTGAVTVTDGFTARDLTFPSSRANVAFGGGFTATNVTLIVANGATLTFTAGQTYGVLNTLVLNGAAGNPIAMTNAAGSWALNVGGYSSVRYVNVKYSNAGGGRTIYPVSSTDGGSNPNWDFGAGKLWVGADTDWTNAANWSPVGAPGSSSVVLMDGSSATNARLTNTTTIAGLTVAGIVGPVTLYVDMPSADAALEVTGNLDIGNNATLTHSANPAGTAEVYRLVLNVSSNLSIAAGGKIDVSLNGYAGGYGPGTTPAGEQGKKRAGAGHGGQGGRCMQSGFACEGGTTYGSVINPIALGSGGGVPRGGGAVIMRVAGAMMHHGSIMANGGPGGNSENYGGGAGGSINLTASTLSGNGTMTAAGGNGSDGWNMGGGGGGRIAVALTGGDFSVFPVTNITAFGGSIDSYDGNKEPGAAGTVYLQAAAQGASKGVVTIDNSNLTTAARTHIPPATNAVLNELRYVSMVVTNRGAMGVTTSAKVKSLTVASGNEPLDLGPAGTELEVSQLIVHGTAYTKGGNYTTNNWNGFATPSGIVGDGAILIPARGTIFLIR